MGCIITILQLGFPIFCGTLIGSLIMGSANGIKISLILLVADFFLGVTLSMIRSKLSPSEEEISKRVEFIRAYGRAVDAERELASGAENEATQEKNIESEKEEEDLEESGRKELSAYEKRIIELIKLEEASNMFRGNAIKGDEPTRRKLVSDFYAIYLRLKMGGERGVNDVMEDEACACLVDFCNWIEYPPNLRTFTNITAVGAQMIGNAPAIIYVFSPPMVYIASTLKLALVWSTENKLRLFAVEAGARRTLVLCEYTGHSHLNYGEVCGNNITNRIKEILNEK